MQDCGEGILRGDLSAFTTLLTDHCLAGGYDDHDEDHCDDHEDDGGDDDVDLSAFTSSLTDHCLSQQHLWSE